MLPRLGSISKKIRARIDGSTYTRMTSSIGSLVLPLIVQYVPGVNWDSNQTCEFCSEGFDVDRAPNIQPSSSLKSIDIFLSIFFLYLVTFRKKVALFSGKASFRKWFPLGCSSWLFSLTAVSFFVTLCCCFRKEHIEMVLTKNSIFSKKYLR